MKPGGIDERRAGSGPMDPAITILARDLSLGYGRVPVLEHVNLEVRTGEFWFFIGPNGTGKSTLLRAVLGSIKPREGTLQLAPGLASRRRIGFVPQRCDLKPTLPMNVAEFVLLGLAGTRTSRAEAHESLEWALERTGLSGKIRRNYWSLSGGQRQRALVARGLVRRPELLVLDEPTNGLDIAAEESLIQVVSTLNRDPGITVIFVTHVISIALRFGDHAALFRGGTIVAGPRQEVLTEDNLSDAYGVEIHLSNLLPVQQVGASGPRK